MTVYGSYEQYLTEFESHYGKCICNSATFLVDEFIHSNKCREVNKDIDGLHNGYTVIGPLTREQFNEIVSSPPFGSLYGSLRSN